MKNEAKLKKNPVIVEFHYDIDGKGQCYAKLYFKDSPKSCTIVRRIDRYQPYLMENELGNTIGRGYTLHQFIVDLASEEGGNEN